MTTISLREEAAGLLQDLIRLDTVNPPGNETLVAEHLREYLEGQGIECELYARVPERANLVARIPGSGEGPILLTRRRVSPFSTVAPTGGGSPSRCCSVQPAGDQTKST